MICGDTGGGGLHKNVEVREHSSAATCNGGGNP